MGKTATNISIVLGLITITFAGYYLYTQQAANTPSVDSNDQTMENMLTNTREFIGYRQTLDKISLDITMFENDNFTSLRDYRTPIQVQSVGRPDPFEIIGNEGTDSF